MEDGRGGGLNVVVMVGWPRELNGSQIVEPGLMEVAEQAVGAMGAAVAEGHKVGLVLVFRRRL